MTPSAIVQKLWNYCNVLPACAEPGAAGRRDDLSACLTQVDGMSYLLARHLTARVFAQAGAQASGDHVEQLTYLLFLKMAHERTRRRNVGS